MPLDNDERKTSTDNLDMLDLSTYYRRVLMAESCDTRQEKDDFLRRCVKSVTEVRVRPNSCYERHSPPPPSEGLQPNTPGFLARYCARPLPQLTLHNDSQRTKGERAEL
jgi:hypothetical protein